MLHIYTDGSCPNNGLEGALATWGYTVTNTENEILESSTGRVIGKQDNNRAELTACFKALQFVQSVKDTCVIHVDYEALYLFCMGKNKPKANLDLYAQISEIYRQVENRTMVIKVGAHKGRKAEIVHYINGLVDKMARKAIILFSTDKPEENSNRSAS